MWYKFGNECDCVCSSYNNYCTKFHSSIKLKKHCIEFVCLIIHRSGLEKKLNSAANK